MDLQTLSQFLVKAKLDTYAKSGETGEVILPDGRKRFEFSDGDFKYIDIYSGFNPFAGQETVYYQDQLVWEMSYQGEISDQEIEAKQVYQFLKKALQQVKIDKPFRGPSRLTEGEFEYINKVEGNIKKFQGVEKICLNKKEVYQLSYSGGVRK